MSAKSTRRRIGILGGMGPEATVLLMARVVAMTAAGDDGDHVPMVVDNNTQVPSFFPCLDTIDILAEAIIEFAGADLRNNFPRNALRQKNA